MRTVEEIKKFGINQHAEFIRRNTKEVVVSEDLARWWCRGISGATDLVVKKSALRTFGPSALQLVKDSTEKISSLTEQKPKELNTLEHDLFVLEGLFLLVKHLEKYKILLTPQLFAELARLNNVLGEQTLKMR